EEGEEAREAQKEEEEKAAEAARKKAEKLAAKREKKKAETSEPEEKAEEVLVSAAEPEETVLTVAPEEPEPVEVIPEVPEPVEVIPEEAEPEEKTHRPEEPLLEGESEFDRSIRVFREEDTGTVREPKKKGAGIVRAFFLVFFGAVFIISTWSFFENAYEKYKSDKIYGKLQEQFEDIAFEDDTGESTLLTLLEADRKSPATPTLDEILENGVPEKDDPGRDVDLERMRASLTSLANINPDIYGWIKIPGTTVNYPIAQSDDNEYYLDHAYTGDNLTNGSIYADYRCDAYVPNNRNTVLYGHNITTGTMFHAVEDFFDRDLFDNAKIYLYTYDGVFIYKAFSVHETAYDSGYIRPYFTDDNDFVAFINALAADSDVKAKDLTLDADSKILTMSTCTSSVRSTRRYALHAVLVDSVTDK
ncbi:MAG: class B sortase, partial [Clostridia bacterium]|nr:class B sortase [Clostridia bacterium]